MLVKLYKLLRQMEEKIGGECQVSIRYRNFGLDLEVYWLAGHMYRWVRHYDIETLQSSSAKEISARFIKEAKAWHQNALAKEDYWGQNDE